MPVKKYLPLEGLELENVLIEEAVAGRRAGRRSTRQFYREGKLIVKMHNDWILSRIAILEL